MRPFDKGQRVRSARNTRASSPLANRVHADADRGSDLALIDADEERLDIHDAHKSCACGWTMSSTKCAVWETHDMCRAATTIFASSKGKSRTVKPHREILADLLRAQRLSYDAVAKRMGWKSPRSVSHKLRGTRDWATGELERMCKVAGITLVQLAEMSNDLHLTKTPEAISAARIVDELPAARREAALQYLKALQGSPSDPPAKK